LNSSVVCFMIPVPGENKEIRVTNRICDLCLEKMLFQNESFNAYH
jgi:hypothetical protein